MTLALAFWVIMIVWLVFGFVTAAPGGGIRGYGGHILLFVLFAIIGWQVFGPAIHR